MTEQDFNKAKELFDQRDYYKKLAYDVDYAVRRKDQEDEKAREYIAEGHVNPHKERWTLAEYFKVRFFNKTEKGESMPKATIGVRPHWDFARDIEIKADRELINLIYEWLKKKEAELDEQIANIEKSGKCSTCRYYNLELLYNPECENCCCNYKDNYEEGKGVIE